MPYYCMHFSSVNDINIANIGTFVWNDSGNVVRSAMSISDVESVNTISTCGMNTKIPINTVKYQFF